jgi:hypothetical protein
MKPRLYENCRGDQAPAFALASLILALAAGSGACAPTSSLPGTALGNYDVVGTLGTNTCGSGVNASSPWDFTAELSQDGTTLYLAKSDGTDEVSGPLASTDATSATLISVVTANADESDSGVAGPCNLTLSTTFALTLAAGSPPKTFTGTAVYTYTPATAVSSNNDCTDQLSASGGPYSTLPCTVNYSLSATRQ